MKQLDDIKKLAEIASSQWGMFTTAQAEKLDVSRLQLSRLVEKEQIERLSFGVYRMAGVPRERLDDIRAAWLSVDPKKSAAERQNEKENGITIGGHTAAYLFDAGDLWPNPFLFISPERRQTQRDEIQFRKRKLAPEDVTLVNGIPVTTPECTIAVLAAEGEDLSHIADVVFAFSKNRSMHKDRLRELLSPYAKKYGFSNRGGEAFVQYLFEGVSQSKAWEISENLASSVKPIIDNASYKDFLKHINPLQELMSSQTFMTAADQAEQIGKVIGNLNLQAISNQTKSVRKILDSDTFREAIAQQEQIRKIIGNLDLKAISEQVMSASKLVNSAAYKTAIAQQTRKETG